MQEVIFATDPIPDSAISYFSPVFTRDLDFCSVKVRAALIVFGKVITSNMDYGIIDWLRDDSRRLFRIATSICNVRAKEIVSCSIPEASTLQHIINYFNDLLNKVFAAMETKSITFGHLKALSDHYETYQALFGCTSEFSQGSVRFIAKEEIVQALECASKISELLVKKPVQYEQLANGGYVKFQACDNT